jgi:hypothetical protein
MSFHADNPFKRGKQKLIANLILDDKTNDEIRDYWVVNELGARVGDLRNELLHNTRSELKKRGLLDDLGFPIKKVEPISPKEGTPSPAPSPAQESLGEEEGETVPPAVPIEEVRDFQRHAEWDLLTLDQIGHIVDPSLRARILNYKTEINKVKQELKPEYATRGEIDLLRNEVSGRMGDIQETLNTLLSKLDDPNSPEEEEGEPEEEEEEEPEVEVKKLPPQLVSAVNRLDAEQESDPQESSGDDIIEVEGMLVARKNIGLTAKSLMLYDLVRNQGFKGNLADFVNSCISDAFKGRSIELAVIDKKVIR